jgi:VanZ like family
MPRPDSRIRPTRRRILKLGSAAWLAGWAAFGLPWGGVSLRERRPINVVPFRSGSYRRSDLVMNFAYYVPLGLIGELTGWPGRATVVTAAGLSALTEVIQVFARDRYPSVTDVILNTAGAVAGITLVRIVRGSRSPDRQHSARKDRNDLTGKDHPSVADCG